VTGRLALGAALAALAAAGACEGKPRAPAPAGGSGSGGAGSSGGSGGSGGDRGAQAAQAPAISPEASKLPGVLWFVEDRPEHKLVRLAGGARTEITTPGGDLYPSPSVLPDGRLVAIASRGDGGPDSEQLALVRAAGDVQRIGPAAAMVRSPASDPRGRWIVFAASTDGHSDLYRVDLAAGSGSAAAAAATAAAGSGAGSGSNSGSAAAAAPAKAPLARLTSDPQGNFEPARLGDDAVAFASSRDGDSEIYRMPAAGGKPQRLTAFHRDDWGAAPSPDGKTIAFLSDREGRARIFLMAADGTQLRRLTDRKDRDREEGSPVWSPDGRSIAYLVAGGGESNLWLRDVAAGTERVLTPLRVRDLEPCFSPDGAWIAVSRGKSEHEGDLWAVPTAPGGEALRLTAGPGLERLPRWVR
jgi:TolB protein